MRVTACCCSEPEVKKCLVKIYLMLGLTMVVFAGGTLIALNVGQTLVGSYISASYTNLLKFRHCYAISFTDIAEYKQEEIYMPVSKSLYAKLSAYMRAAISRYRTTLTIACNDVTRKYNIYFAVNSLKSLSHAMCRCKHHANHIKSCQMSFFISLHLWHKSFTTIASHSACPSSDTIIISLSS